MSAEIIHRQFTSDEYLRMAEVGILDEDDRVELIDGEILVMSPIGHRHNSAVAAVHQMLIEQLRRRAIVLGQSTVPLGRFDVPEPDIALVKYRDDFYSQRYPGPDDMLLVVEVADSSLKYDTTKKLGLYAAAGIPEYWVADLQTNRLLVHTKPVGNSYSEVRELLRGQSVFPQAFPDVSLPVDLLLP